MFSSLATFLFGAQATSEPTNCEANPVNPVNLNDSGNDQATANNGDVIEVTSSTPSVAGNSRGTVRNGNGKRVGAKNRRARQRQLQQQQQQQGQGQRKQAPTITKLLTPNSECSLDEDINEDEWYIVEKEDEEEDSLPRSDSEEELSVVELQPKAGSTAGGAGAGAGAAASGRRRPHLNSHSLYSGPRPQQQRNYLQRTRAARTLSISTLSPPRSVPAADSDNDNAAVSQSLYAPNVAAVSPCSSEKSSSSSGSDRHGSGVLMEESWYVTPPPCFTSIGPINMEASPFENLLIEHPSMSVYHSIRSSQAANESFVNLDLGAAAAASQQPVEPEPEPVQAAAAVQQQRSNSNARFDRHAAAELKQQTLARHSQKSNNKKQHQQLCRSAIKRSNKVRDIQAKGQRPRRSDMQHCKLVSGANNNRKCC